MTTSYLVVLHYIAATLVVLRVLTRSGMEPTIRLVWIMLVEAVPVLGICGYLMFGEIRIERAERQRAADIRAKLSGMWTPSPDAVADPPERIAGLTATALAVGGMVPVAGNRLRLEPEGDDAFDEMIAAIDGAQDHVHVLFYIWLDDKLGGRMVDAVSRAARRGVACRIVVDDLGSRRFLRSENWRIMDEAGVELVRAMPTGNVPLRALTRRLDLRNHRKIVLIDNCIAFTGSRNAADMAFAVKPRYAPWYDVWFAVEGPVVRQMQGVFLADWMTYTGADLGKELLKTVPAAETPGAVAQVIATGPDRRAGSVSDCIMALLAMARKSIVITTPYYVPTAALDNAIQACARRGVDVTLILPANNNSMLVAASSEVFYRGLLRAGVRLMLFEPGLLHAKLMTVDGEVTLLGSGNLDRRSFELNYEINLIVVDREKTAEIDQRQASYVARAREVTLEEVEHWPFWRKIRNNTLSLATPLL